MVAYAGTRFRVRTFGVERLCLEPATLLVVTHRSDEDVPLLCGTLYAAARFWRRRDVRIAFAVRDDMLEPSFLAGYPPGLPLAVRRMLWRLSFGETLRRRLGCLPIRSATSMRLVQLLREAPTLPLRRLAPSVLTEVERRAEALGLTLPAAAGGLDRPEYAALLWGIVERSEFDSPELEPVWRRRAAAAVGDFRRLVAVVRGGGRLLIFPEGRPSPDGAIGPLLPGFSALVRRGGVSTVQPIALAYDPLGPGRTRAYVSVGAPFAPPAEGVDAALLTALRRAMPLTAGQLAARAALDGGHVAPETAAAEIERALARARPVDHDLLAPERAARLAEGIAAAGRASGWAARLAREAESASADAG